MPTLLLPCQTAIATLGMGAGTLVAGFFGMNLVSGLEDHATAFFWATGSGLGLMAREFPLSQWVPCDSLR